MATWIKEPTAVNDESIEIELIFPEQDGDELSLGLMALTEAIAKRLPDEVAHGMLGGEFGYGAYWDSDLFMMHPFCWCEQSDCAWCGGCECPETTLHFLIDDRDVTRQEWMDYYHLHVHGMTEAEIYASGRHPFDMPSNERLSKEANEHRSQRHDPECDYCLVKGVFAEKGAEADRGAPNFWHKPSGFKVWWYKYIGRDMETSGEVADTGTMIDECIASLKAAA
jgi:hypothetical protein